MIKLEEPLVSVIVVNYNGIRHLRECFDSLSNQTYKNLEVILVDNNSIDNSVSFIKKNYQNVKVIQLDKNYGFTGGNLIGIRYSTGKYIVLLNNDTYADKNWLKELIKVAESSDKIGIVGSKIYFYDSKAIINYAGGVIDKYGKVSHIGENKPDLNILNVQKETFYACGAALLIKRDVYNRIGLFDPQYFAYYEDLDLCWRAWIFGYRVVYAPKSFIFHKIEQVLRKNIYKRDFYGERNLLRTLLKNYELNSLFKVLLVFVGRRIGKIVRFFFNLDKRAFIYLLLYIKSFFWNITHMRSLLEKRKFLQFYRKKTDNFLFQLMDKTINFK